VGLTLDDLKLAIQSLKEDKYPFFNPHINTRVPAIDKPSIAFPGQITEVNKD